MEAFNNNACLNRWNKQVLRFRADIAVKYHHIAQRTELNPTVKSASWRARGEGYKGGEKADKIFCSIGQLGFRWLAVL